jgi:hypothetical protein
LTRNWGQNIVKIASEKKMHNVVATFKFRDDVKVPVGYQNEI